MEYQKWEEIVKQLQGEIDEGGEGTKDNILRALEVGLHEPQPYLKNN